MIGLLDWRTVMVLDHGFVHLRDSMPALHMDGVVSFGPGDQRIVDAARVSMAHLPCDVLDSVGLEAKEENRTVDQDIKLIQYLVTNRHTTPLEQVRFTFIAKMPIFVARQWVRHRMASINEMSARYSKLPCEFYVPEPQRMQAQSTANKQGSAEQLPLHVVEMLCAKIQSSSATAYAAYESLLDYGLARELARMVLPTNFYTQWYWTTDLHNLSQFLRLRLDSHAQYEIRVYAEAMLGMARRVCPAVIAALGL